MYRHGVALPLTTTHPQRLALSPTETYLALGISENTLYRWLKRGTIASFKVDGRRFIPITELERLLTPPPRDSEALTTNDAWSADHNTD
jgi:excisionase family DNA binding protein